MINHNFILIIIVIILLTLVFYKKTNFEHFVPGKVCTNPKASNYMNPANLTINDKSDDCVCEFPDHKVVCSRYFSVNYEYPDYTNNYNRCHDSDAYNFELNSKIPNNNLCQYENNDTCIFPTSLSNINSLYDIIDNPEEYLSLHNDDGSINYNNILRFGPCISKNKHRDTKLDLYFRLFNRKAINLSLNSSDPIFNLWDLAGKISIDQLKADYGKVIKSYTFIEETIETKIDVLGYGQNMLPEVSYNEIVNNFNNNLLSSNRIKHVALAISKDGSKYAIGIGNTKDSAMDIAILNAILFEPITEKNIDIQHNELNRSYTRTIHLFNKAKLMNNSDYTRIKKDINDKRIVNDEDKLLVLYRDKMNENDKNPVGILMINNDRYFKYPNNSDTLNKCLNVVKQIESKCFDSNKIVNGERNCNEVIMIRHDKANEKCTIIQNNKNIIKNSEYDFSKSNNLKEMNLNTPIKMVNSTIIDSSCNDKDVDCFIYSINDKRFCKG